MEPELGPSVLQRVAWRLEEALQLLLRNAEELGVLVQVLACGELHRGLLRGDRAVDVQYLAYGAVALASDVRPDFL